MEMGPFREIRMKKTAPGGIKVHNDTRHVEIKDENDTRHVEIKNDNDTRQLERDRC